MNYEFTEDWFVYGRNLWPGLTQFLPANSGPRRFLEIGSFEGRSTVWLIENMMKSFDEIVCIDTWAGGEEHFMNMGDVEKRFDANVALAMTRFPNVKVTKVKDASYYGLARQMGWLMFDFIYIDGSHQAPDVLADAVMGWKLLREGGVMVFDDYLWGNPKNPLHRPKPAIDAFTEIHAGELSFIHLGYQLVIKKEQA